MMNSEFVKLWTEPRCINYNHDTSFIKTVGFGLRCEERRFKWPR